MRWRLVLPASVAAVVALAAALAFRTGDEAGTQEMLGPGEVPVELGIEYSRFSADRLRVRPGPPCGS
jgi:hypothetical protein